MPPRYVSNQTIHHDLNMPTVHQTVRSHSEFETPMHSLRTPLVALAASQEVPPIGGVPTVNAFVFVQLITFTGDVLPIWSEGGLRRTDSVKRRHDDAGMMSGEVSQQQHHHHNGGGGHHAQPRVPGKLGAAAQAGGPPVPPVHARPNSNRLTNHQRNLSLDFR
ncbi:hypothetical protein AAG570_006026 [Ranatra chinensis]|uniref:Uncharacterized protein n=1 Tax=Ranatra chinensis TaxID=642074 RepID=A0ABD0XWU2_9HEMI